MLKKRLLVFVFCLILPISTYVQADTKGSLFFSTGFYNGIFFDESLHVVSDLRISRLNIIKLGVGWELSLGRGNTFLGLEAGYSSGSRFGGHGHVDYYPLTVTAAYAFPLGGIFYMGPSLKLGGFIMAGPEWADIIPLAGMRLEAELRNRQFPLSLYAAGGLDIFIPVTHNSSMLPVLEMGLRFSRGSLRRREGTALLNEDDPLPVPIGETQDAHAIQAVQATSGQVASGLAAAELVPVITPLVELTQVQPPTAGLPDAVPAAPSQAVLELIPELAPAVEVTQAQPPATAIPDVVPAAPAQAAPEVAPVVTPAAEVTQAQPSAAGIPDTVPVVPEQAVPEAVPVVTPAVEVTQVQPPAAGIPDTVPVVPEQAVPEVTPVVTPAVEVTQAQPLVAEIPEAAPVVAPVTEVTQAQPLVAEIPDAVPVAPEQTVPEVAPVVAPVTEVTQAQPLVAEIPDAVPAAPEQTVPEVAPVVTPATEVTQAQPREQVLLLHPNQMIVLDDGRQGILNSIYFEPDTAVLIESSRPILDDVGMQLEANPALQVLIRTYTALFGTPAGRLMVSMNRARFVLEYFSQNYGVTASRITIQAFASERLPELATDEFETHRCAELIIIVE
jgi:outer membrane protein OmpA-like peptidoglycan-associated protein